MIYIMISLSVLSKLYNVGLTIITNRYLVHKYFGDLKFFNKTRIHDEELKEKKNKDYS